MSGLPSHLVQELNAGTVLNVEFPGLSLFKSISYIIFDKIENIEISANFDSRKIHLLKRKMKKDERLCK